MSDGGQALCRVCSAKVQPRSPLHSPPHQAPCQTSSKQPRARIKLLVAISNTSLLTKLSCCKDEMAQFAPYQDTAPDITRSLSPPPKSPSPRPPQVQRNIGTAAIHSPPTSPSYQNNHNYFNPGAGWSDPEADQEQPEQSSSGGLWSRRTGIDLYETSLGIRLDWEACIAYLALPPAGAAVLLVLEHRSDYVRYEL